jgi:hypothetical protein
MSVRLCLLKVFAVRVVALLAKEFGLWKVQDPTGSKLAYNIHDQEAGKSTSATLD